MKDLKTTGAGIVSILAGAINIYLKKSVGPEDVAALTTGVGLIFAKDAGVSGTAR